MRGTDIATVARWTTVAANGQIGVGGALPDCSVDIVPKGTIQRVLFSMVCSGAATSDGTLGYKSFQGIYLLNKIIYRYPGRPDHSLHESQKIIPMSTSAMFDSTQVPPPVGQNRLFYSHYYAGDNELGENIKTSYGGPLKPFQAAVLLQSGIFQIGAGNFNTFPLGYNCKLRVLVYS